MDGWVVMCVEVGAHAGVHVSRCGAWPYFTSVSYLLTHLLVLTPVLTLLFFTLLYSALLYFNVTFTLLYFTFFCFALLYFALLSLTLRYFASLYFNLLRITSLHVTSLQYSWFHFTSLYYTPLPFTWFLTWLITVFLFIIEEFGETFVMSLSCIWLFGLNFE